MKKTYIRVVISIILALILLLGMTSFADAKGPAQYSVSVTQADISGGPHDGHTHLRTTIAWDGYWTDAYYYAFYEWEEASSSWVFRYENTYSVAYGPTRTVVFDYDTLDAYHDVQPGEQWKVVTTLIDKKGKPAKRFIHKGTVYYTVQP